MNESILFTSGTNENTIVIFKLLKQNTNYYNELWSGVYQLGRNYTLFPWLGFKSGSWISFIYSVVSINYYYY